MARRYSEGSGWSVPHVPRVADAGPGGAAGERH